MSKNSRKIRDLKYLWIKMKRIQLFTDHIWRKYTLVSKAAINVFTCKTGSQFVGGNLET